MRFTSTLDHLGLPRFHHHRGQAVRSVFIEAPGNTTTGIRSRPGTVAGGVLQRSLARPGLTQGPEIGRHCGPTRGPNRAPTRARQRDRTP